MLRASVLSGLVAVLSGMALYAQSPSLPLRRDAYGADVWRAAEGLAQSRIRAITQTRDGYLWLGTDGGLIRFNGQSFTAFTIETGDLKDNEVWALQEDNDGGLWIGTYGGGLTLLKHGLFRTYSTTDGLPDDVILALTKDRAGSIWMTTPAGPARYSQGIFTRFAQGSGLPDSRLATICGDAEGGVLTASRAGLHRFTGTRFEPLGMAPDHLFCGVNGAVWLTSPNGVIRRRSAEKTAEYHYDPLRGRITLLHEDSRGGVWAVIGKRLTHMVNGVFEPVPVDDPTVDPASAYSLFLDREGNLWAGLQSNGLARLRMRPLMTLSVEDGLPDERVRTVFEDSKHLTWVGTADGLTCFQGGRARAFTEVRGVRLGDVRSIAEDRDGIIWISAGRDLFRFLGDRFEPVLNWPARHEIEVLFRDPEGTMWVGTDGDGLFRYSGRGFVKFSGGGLEKAQIRGLLSDRNGALWISTFGSGVTRYASGAFRKFGTADKMAGDRVLAMHQDEEGAMWFATRRGLSRLQDDRFFTFTAESGLLTGFVYSILDDGRGNFWFSSAQGLFRASKAELRAFAAGRLSRVMSVAYTEKDGMKTRAGNLGNQPAAGNSSSGQLMFSSMKGLIVMEPDRLTPDHYVPPVRIEEVLVNRREQSPAGPLEAPLGAGELEIHFAALSFTAPEKLRFRYMLEGFDADWSESGGRRFIHYTNLPPGNYRFRVMAGNSDGAWNETGAAISLYLRPPFYRTWIFLTFAIAAAGLTAYMIYRLRMSGLRSGYAAVLAERNSISRDIHDTLSQNLAGIALQLDALQMRLPGVDSQLSQTLDEACSLTRYSLAEARKAIADLRSDELEPRELDKALPEIASRIANALPTHLTVSGEPVRLERATETNLVRIFKEALTNSVRHAGAKRVDIELRYSVDDLTLRVSDDGHGFNPGTAPGIAEGHFGLVGMRERAERIGGRLTLRSAPESGTELCVRVPYPSGRRS